MSNEFRRYTIILQLLFGGFSNPQESRFVKLFSKDSSQSEESSTSKKSAYKSLNIKSTNIENGKDKRTTIIIKNLPNDISKEELKSINNLPCAYVNVINYKSILNIIKQFDLMKNNSSNQNSKDFSKIEIFYSGTQGKSALINRFRLEKKYLPPNQTISFS
jgi:hypothetical protein